MMSTVSMHRPEIVVSSHRGFKVRRVSSASWTMSMDSQSSEKTKKKDLSVQLPTPPVPKSSPVSSSGFQFNRLQSSGRESIQESIKEFGQFFAREAVLDEEYWTAAWLRAESHWETRLNERYAESYKRKFAEQEFNALKRRCEGLRFDGQKCTCIVMVRKEGKIKNTVLKSVVGTLDLNIRYMLPGESFPGERINAPLFCNISKKDPSRYGYIANLCVAKSARRKGIASNMLHFALASAKSKGVEQVYVHVHRDNRPALELYEKMGFETVGMASPQLIEERTYLLSVGI